MDDTGKYLIHATFVADGVVERSDVVGAVFGQTEGLLGDELDIRGLQESAKLGRIDVSVESEEGTSQGEITIASSLDRVETATLAAALEAIERIGPCRARVETAHIEDVRAAKRREVVERAKELLATAFDESVMDSRAILEEVRESIRVEDITEYQGLPAGPNVETSDAVIVVEGRADVLNLLRYGIKNAIGVEGTNVPEAVAELTTQKTVTAFLDGDRGGDLIRQELEQVGEVEYIARAPEGKAVEDLSRSEVDAALRNKVPVEVFEGELQQAVPNGSSMTVESAEGSAERSADETGANPAVSSPDAATEETSASEASSTAPESGSEDADRRAATAVKPGTRTEPADLTAPESVEQREATEHIDPSAETDVEDEGREESSTESTEEGGDAADSDVLTLADHAADIEDSGQARLLDDELAVVETVEADSAFDAIETADPVPMVVVVDGEITQRLVDVASQRGVGELIGASAGEFVKQPTSVKVKTFDSL